MDNSYICEDRVCEHGLPYDNYCEECDPYWADGDERECDHCGKSDCDGMCAGSDCMRDPETGMCGKAGSEECDFECPYRG